MKKKSILPIIIIFFLILLGCAAGALYVLQYSDLLLKPNQKFLKYAGSAINDVIEAYPEPFKSMEAKNEGKTIKTTTKQDYEFDISDLFYGSLSRSYYGAMDDEGNVEEDTEEPTKLKINIQSVTKMSEGPKMSERVTASLDKATTKKIINELDEDMLEELTEALAPDDEELEGDDLVNYFTKEPFIDLLFYYGDNSAGIRTDSLYSKGFVIQNNNLKKLYKNLLDADEVPKGLPNKITAIETLSSTEGQEKVIAFLKTHAESVMLSLDESKFTSEKTPLDYNGENYASTDKVSLELTANDFVEGVKKFIEEIQNDSQLTELFGNESNTYIKEFSDKLKDIKIEEDSVKVKISLYVSKGKVVKIEVSTPENETIEYAYNGEKGLVQVTIPAKESKYYTTPRRTFTIAIENNASGDTYTTTAVLSARYDEESVKDKESSSSLSSYIDERYSPVTATLKIESKVVSDNTINSVVNTVTQYGEDDSEETTYEIITEYTDEGVEELNSSNSVVLNSVKKDEFEELRNEIIENLMTKEEDHFDIIYTYFKNLVSLMNNFTDVTRFDVEDYEPLDPFAEEDATTVDEEDEDDEEDSDPTPLTPATPAENEATKIEKEIKTVLTDCLDDFKKALEDDSNANLADYLNIEKINEDMPSNMPTELIDGTTLEVKYNDKTYEVKIEIDGSSWELTSCSVDEK